MIVRLNGEPREVPDGTDVAALLRGLGRDFAAAPVAVAVNLRVVPRDELPRRVLRDGDRIDVVGAVGGG